MITFEHGYEYCASQINAFLAEHYFQNSDFKKARRYSRNALLLFVNIPHSRKTQNIPAPELQKLSRLITKIKVLLEEYDYGQDPQILIEKSFSEFPGTLPTATTSSRPVGEPLLSLVK